MRAISLSMIVLVVIIGCDRKETGRPASDSGWTSLARLHAAVRKGDLPLVQSLIMGGCNVDARDEDGATPLFVAAAYGQTSIAKFLISKDADVNARSVNGHTALHIAASHTHVSIAMLLIDAGADVNAGLDSGDTPLYVVSHLSDDQSHEDIARLLLDRGASIAPGDTRENGNLLYFAVTRRMHTLVEKLLAAGANPNTVETGATGMNVLRKAVALGDVETAGLLVAGGADVNGKDATGMPPLAYARRWSTDVVELLLAKGADPSVGFLLHHFVNTDEKEVLEICLKHGADVNARNLAGETPLDVALAFASGRQEIAELLKSQGGVRGEDIGDAHP